MAEQPLEEFLRNSQGVLSLVLDSIPAAIMVVDRKAVCVYLTHECTGLTGYTFEDVRADQRALSDICSEAVKCLSTGATPWQGWGGAVLDRELSVRCKDERSMPIHMRAAALTGENVIVTLSDSAVAGYIGLMSAGLGDPKKEEEFRGSENEFRTLAEKSLSLTGVFLIQEGFIRYANSRFAETFGYAVKELIDRKRPQDLMPPEEWSDLERQMETERPTDKPVSVHREFRGITKSGEVIYVEIYGSFTMADGSPPSSGHCSTLRNGRQRKRCCGRQKRSTAISSRTPRSAYTRPRRTDDSSRPTTRWRASLATTRRKS